MSAWSPELLEQTCAVVEGKAFVPLGDRVHFKSIDGGFGTIDVSDTLSGRLLLVERKARKEKLYADAEALIADGWVIY